MDLNFFLDKIDNKVSKEDIERLVFDRCTRTRIFIHCKAFFLKGGAMFFLGGKFSVTGWGIPSPYAYARLRRLFS